MKVKLFISCGLGLCLLLALPAGYAMQPVENSKAQKVMRESDARTSIPREVFNGKGEHVPRPQHDPNSRIERLRRAESEENARHSIPLEPKKPKPSTDPARGAR